MPVSISVRGNVSRLVISPYQQTFIDVAGTTTPQAKLSDPNGIRTRVTAVKGRCPGPLDDRVTKPGNIGIELLSRKTNCRPRLFQHPSLVKYMLYVNHVCLRSLDGIGERVGARSTMSAAVLAVAPR